MAMTVNTNTFSLNAQRQLMRTESGLQTSMQRLSSGLRINSAKDDAAGLQIANRMKHEDIFGTHKCAGVAGCHGGNHHLGNTDRQTAHDCRAQGGAH